MAIRHGAASWALRFSGGPLKYKQIYSTSFGFSDTHKKIAAGSATAVLAATTGGTSAKNISSGTSITQPTYPRALSVTPTANTADNAIGIVITGKNSEGKVITENYPIPNNSTTKVSKKAGLLLLILKSNSCARFFRIVK